MRDAASRLPRVAKFIAVPTAIAALIFLCSLRATGQTGQITGIGDTTTTPVAGVPHDYVTGLNEAVNPANGSLSVRIKAPTPHERGVNWPRYVFTYDSSSLYYLVPQWFTSYNGSTYFDALTNLNLAPALPSATGGQTLYPQVTLPSGNGVTTTYECKVTSGTVFTDPEGGRHALGLSVATPVGGYPSNSCQEIPGTPYTDTIGGDAQYKAIIDPSTLAVTVIDNHGDVVGFEDVNGNQTTSQGNATITPTGRQETVSYGTDSSTMTFPGIHGTYQDSWTNVTVNPGSLTLPYTVVNDGGVNSCQMSSIPFEGDQNGSASFRASETVTLPNGESYQFTYDPATHMLSKIVYPTGAYVQYTWQIVPSQEGAQYRDMPSNGQLCAITYGWFAITKRQVSYDGSSIDEEQDFSYTTNWPPTGQSNSYQWTSKTTKVTTIDEKTGKSFDTIYTYSPVTAPPEVASSEEWENLGVVPEEQMIQYYNDTTDSPASLLKTITKTWQSLNLMSGQCEQLGPNGPISGTFYTYQPYSGFGGQGNQVVNPEALLTDLPTDVAEYDYGQVTTPCVRPSSGTIPVRETETTYASFPNTPLFPYASLLDRPSKVQIYGNVNGTQTLEAETDYQYDGTALTPVSGTIVNHDSAYGTTNTVRGNPTQVTRVCTVQSSAPCSYTDSVTNYTYDIAGQAVAVKDPNNNTTQYTYSDSAIAGDGAPPSGYVTDAFLSKITEPPVPAGTFTQNFTWGYNDGRMWSKQDENGNITHFYYTTGGKSGSSYDPFFRLTEADYPDSGYEKVTYNDTRPAVTVTTAINTSGTPVVETKETIYQAMGQDPVETQLQTDPVAIRKVYTYYDGLNRVSQLSNPYWGASDPTYGLTTYTYDALNRTTSIKHPDNTSQTMQYINNSVLFTDENGNQWQRTSDALGRLTQVLEPNGTSKTPSMETDYTYDALGNLTSVAQWGGPSGSSGERTRSFVYNGLSQVRTSNNPETGAITYTYDANGNVKTKTGGASVKTTYGPYDALNRPAGITYSDGVTPPVSFTYDTSSISGSQNTKTRLTSVTVMNGSSMFSQVSPYNYDSMGRAQYIQDCKPTSATACTNYTLTYGYNQAGNVDLMTDGAASPGFTLYSTYDGADQLSLVTSTLNTGNYPGTLFQANSNSSTAPSYGPAGLVNASFGISTSGTTATLNRSYDNRMQVTGETDMEGSNEVYSYSIAPYNRSNPSASGYDAVGNIVSFSDQVMGTWNYAYDTLNRVASATAIAGTYSSAAFTWTIDPFGDRTAQNVTGNPSKPVPQPWTATVSTYNDNRIVHSSPPGANWTYDASGNVTYDGTNYYLYDAANRLCAVERPGTPPEMTGYLYDGNGNRIAKGSLTSFSCNLASNGFSETTSYVVGKDGEQLTEFDGSTPVHTNVFAAGKLLVTYSNSQTYFSFSDWLGTKRVEIGTNNCVSTYASFAYGDELTEITPPGDTSCADATEHHYTGKEHDAESGNDYFGARYYASIVGRWVSPDIPIADQHTVNPQSWNLYIYALNNPLKYVDNNGRDVVSAPIAIGTSIVTYYQPQGRPLELASLLTTFNAATLVPNNRGGASLNYPHQESGGGCVLGCLTSYKEEAAKLNISVSFSYDKNDQPNGATITFSQDTSAAFLFADPRPAKTVLEPYPGLGQPQPDFSDVSVDPRALQQMSDTQLKLLGTAASKMSESTYIWQIGRAMTEAIMEEEQRRENEGKKHQWQQTGP